MSTISLPTPFAIPTDFDIKNYQKNILENQFDPKTGWNSLHTALWYGNLELVLYLLHHGANATEKTQKGRTPLQLIKKAANFKIRAHLKRILVYFIRQQNNKNRSLLT